jgi:membrane-associated phospholipid phosphatase
MIRAIAHLISICFHPLVLFIALLWTGYLVDPYAYALSSAHEVSVTAIMTVAILFVIPVVTVLMMKGLGFIKSLRMEDPKERIGPMIASIICFVWFYVNMKSNANVPSSFLVLALGGCIALALAFFINNFSKISLHTTGAGAFLTGVIILMTISSNKVIDITLFGSIWQLHPMMLILVATVIGGLVGTSRLLLEAHRPVDIYGGYLVGIISLVISYRIWF